MAGRFNRKIKAATAHRMVVEPSIGKTPSTIPNARLRAIFSGVIPWIISPKIGSTTRR